MTNEKYTSFEKAVELIKSGDRVFIHTAGATPNGLVNAMTDRANQLRNVELVSMHTEGPAPYIDDKYSENFKINSFFVSANIRKAVESGRANYIPMFLSEIPIFFRSGNFPIDVALLTVSPPDKHGYCSLGISVDVARAASEMAKTIIVEVNPNMPRTHGEALIHSSRFAAMVYNDVPVHELHLEEPNEQELKIGRYIAELVEDGSALQMGIGAIPNAALVALKNHRDLGIHSEMISDGILELVERGVITGRFKKVVPNIIVSGFALGTRKLYDFLDDNPNVAMMDIQFVNDSRVIRKNPKTVAINSAVEVDLFGQVSADTIGFKQYSGVGGQMDFIRGASLSQGGKPIIALPSQTANGISRITAQLKPGAGVVTTRAHVHYIITEYGVAHVYGKNLRERANALISIAAPEHREELARQAHENLKTLRC